MFILMVRTTFTGMRSILASSFFWVVFIVLPTSFAAYAQTGSVQKSPASTAVTEPGVDVRIKPGDDFFAYANGGWLNATDIPAGKARWTVWDEITELSRQQVLTILDDAVAAPSGLIARKVADFSAAYLNDAAIEAKGRAALRPMLDRIDRVHNKASLTRLLGSELRADVDPMNVGIFRSAHILGLAVQASIHGEKDYVAFLVQGGLGLADRENYLSAEADMQVQRAQRLEAIGRVLALIEPGTAGTTTATAAKTTAKRAEAVMALETAIAQSHATAEVSGN